MNTTRLRQVRRLYPDHDGPHGPISSSAARHNRRAWVRAVRHLGPKWLLAHHVQRKTEYPQ